MKIIMISTDRKIFETSSDVRRRMIRYGSLVEVLHIIVFSKKEHNCSYVQIANNVFVYSTDSKSRWHYLFDAIRIGKGLPKPDLVTAQDPAETGLVGYRLARFFSAGLELQVHGDLFGHAFKKESLLNRGRALVAHWLLPRATGIRVVSERIKRAITDSYKRDTLLPQIAVLPIFVEIPVSVPGGVNSNSDVHLQFSPTILMVSRLTEEKNIEIGIDAFKKVHEHITTAGLVIVGDGSERSHLEGYVKGQGLTESVVFLGWRTDVPTLLTRSDIYMLTSDHEGYARTLVEAALAGCPIVSTDVGIIGDVFKNEQSALVAQPGDAAVLAAQLIRLAKDDTLRRRLADAAAAAVRAHLPTNEDHYLIDLKHSWEAAASSTVSCARSTLCL